MVKVSERQKQLAIAILEEISKTEELHYITENTKLKKQLHQKDIELAKLKSIKTVTASKNIRLNHEKNQLESELSKKRRPTGNDLRHKVFKRDKYMCVECGASKTHSRLTIDHIIPVALGGTNEFDNLQTLCEECNNAKSSQIWVGGTGNTKREKYAESYGFPTED